MVVDDQYDWTSLVVTVAAAAPGDEAAFRSEASFYQPGFRAWVCERTVRWSAHTVKNLDLRMS